MSDHKKTADEINRAIDAALTKLGIEVDNDALADAGLSDHDIAAIIARHSIDAEGLARHIVENNVVVMCDDGGEYHEVRFSGTRQGVVNLITAAIREYEASHDR